MYNTKFMVISTASEMIINKGDKVETIPYKKSESMTGQLTDKLLSRVDEVMAHIDRTIEYLVVYAQSSEIINLLTRRSNICNILGKELRIKYIGYQEDTYQDPVKEAMNEMMFKGIKTCMVINEISCIQNVHISVLELVEEGISLVRGEYKIKDEFMFKRNSETHKSTIKGMEYNKKN